MPFDASPPSRQVLLSYTDLAEYYNIKYSRVHLRLLCKQGRFPRPIQITNQRIAWTKDSIEEFIASRKTITYADKPTPEPVPVTKSKRVKFYD